MIVHNVKGKITQDYPGIFIFDEDLKGAGWILDAAFLKENLRRHGYQFPVKAFASVDIPDHVGGEGVVVEIYFSRKR